MKWLKEILNSVWQYILEKDRDERLSQMIKESREQTKSVISESATRLKVVNPPPRGNIKIKKKGKANGRTK